MRSETPLWRRRLLPAFLALLALNLLVLVAWTIPRSLRLKSATARVEEARRAAEHERARAGEARERAAAIAANTRDLKTFYEEVIGTESAQLLPTLREIEAMANAPGLTAGPRSFNREEVEDLPLERVSVVLPLGGSYAQLVRFLREVERSPRFLTVDRVSLQGKAGREASLQVEISLFMSTGARRRGDDEA